MFSAGQHNDVTPPEANSVRTWIDIIPYCALNLFVETGLCRLVGYLVRADTPALPTIASLGCSHSRSFYLFLYNFVRSCNRDCPFMFFCQVSLFLCNS
jgi:hypothetical protein